MTDAPTFGQPVTFTRTLTRRTEYRDTPGPQRRSECWKVWKSEAYPGEPEPAPRTGIVIGVRTLANGRTEYDYEAGTSFDPTTAERFTAYLVATDLRRKPVLCLPENVTPR